MRFLYKAAKNVVLLLTLVYIYPKMAFSQFISTDGVIQTDSNSNMLNKNLPFDQQFTIKLTYPSLDPPISISIYKINKYGDYLPTSKREYMISQRKFITKPKLKLYLYNPKANSEKIKTYYNRFKNYLLSFTYYKKYIRNRRKYYNANSALFTIDNKKFNKIQKNKNSTTIIVNVPPLNPNKQYRFSLLRRDGSSINSLINVAQDLISGDEHKAKETFNNINKSNYSNDESALSFPFDTLKEKLNISRLVLTEEQNDIVSSDHELYIVPDAIVGFDVKNSMKLSAENFTGDYIYKNISLDFKDKWSLSKSNSFVEGETWRNNPNSWLTGSSYKFFRRSTYRLFPSSPTISSSTSKSFIFDGYSLISSFSNEESGANLSIQPSANSLVLNINKYESALNSITAPLIDLSINFIKKDILDLKCEKMDKTEILTFCQNRNDLLQTVDNLATGHKSKEVIQGFLPINHNTLTPTTNKQSTDVSIENIKKTISLIEELRQFNDYLITYKIFSSGRTQIIIPISGIIGDYAKLSSDLNKYVIELGKSLEALNGINVNKLKFAEVLVDKLDLSKKANTTDIDGTTDNFDFKTRSKFRIVPDFGIITVFRSMKFDNLRSSTDFVPYVGFHINARAINKDIPFKLVRNKTFWHRVSFMAGLSLSSIKAENQREDLFGNKSLVTGFGFRLNNVIKISVGSLWFKSLDKNQLIDKKQLSAAPFVGASFDLELKELFGGIVDLFK